MARKLGRYKSSLKVDKGQMDRLMRAFELFEADIKAGMQQAIQKSAEVARDTAKGNVKWGGATGQLVKNAVIVKQFVTRKDTLQVWDIGMDSRYNNWFYVYSKGDTQYRVYHGYNRKEKDPRWEKKQWYLPSLLEYGTPHTKAQPFLRPALKTTRTTAKKLVAEHLKKVTSRDY